MSTQHRVSGSWRLCGWCRKPVYSHADSYEEREGITKRLWHRKGCWPQEKKRRAKLLKQVAAALEPTGNPGMDDVLEHSSVLVPRELKERINARKFNFPHIVVPNGVEDDVVPPPIPEAPEPAPIPEPEPQPEPQRIPMAALVGPPPKRNTARGSRGLQKATNKILQRQLGIFTVDSIWEELGREGFETTRATVSTMIHTYRRTHPAHKFRMQNGTSTVFLFNKDLLRMLRDIAVNGGNLAVIGQPEQLPLQPVATPAVEVPPIQPDLRDLIVRTLGALSQLVDETCSDLLQALPPGVAKRPVD